MPTGDLVCFSVECIGRGEVETWLHNEHVCHRRFARLLSREKWVDAAGRSDYIMELRPNVVRKTLGVDISQEAIQYAAGRFQHSKIVCAYIPCGSADQFQSCYGSCELITSREVIEHLPNLPVFPDDLEKELKIRFPSVQILAQNEQELIIFASDWLSRRTGGLTPTGQGRFKAPCFVAFRSFLVDNPFFADVSTSDNHYRHRDRRIGYLEGALDRLQQERDEMKLEHDRVCLELDAVRRQVEALKEQERLVRNAAWIRFGRTLGIGPWGDGRQRIKIAFDRCRDAVRRCIEVASRQIEAAGRQIEATGKRIEIAGKWLEPVVPYLQDLGRFIAGPFILGGTFLFLLCLDICFKVFGKKRSREDRQPAHASASIVVPTWNGLELLRANLPSLLAATARVPGSEVIVVDDGSVDGTSAALPLEFPTVRLINLPANRGFAGACNSGAEAARNEVVVFLNNDMQVDANFVSALLPNFADPLVCAVSSQIYFADQKKLGEKTGLTTAWWQKGRLEVGHRFDPLITSAFPCAYPGGGANAFDRAKFLELGGFDRLFDPFYYEYIDLGLGAWKRGWKVLYEPGSLVYQGFLSTIGKTFTQEYIDAAIRRNKLLYCWKNIHDWRLLANHFKACFWTILAARPGEMGPIPTPLNVWGAFKKLRTAAKSRWRAQELKCLSDGEAFRRPLGGYYRDRFLAKSEPSERLNVLFVSPYPIEPQTHGGAVFMKEAVRALETVANVHVVSFVDNTDQLGCQNALLPECHSGQFLVRPTLSLEDQLTILPNAIRQFAIDEFAWAIHRTILLQNIDVVQLEYTTMGQYAGDYLNIPCILFEHDISTQSLARQIKAGDRDGKVILEYFRMRLYERKLLKRVTRVQVCSQDNANYLEKFVSGLKQRVDADVRAAIDVQRYPFVLDDREAESLLFIGSFRHLLNVNALRWFASEVFPLIVKERPQTVLYIAGSDLTHDIASGWHPNIQVLGTVPDVRVPLQRYSVFVCPVLSGSGIRVKLLEAFASGIPAVSTRVGAEGLWIEKGHVCKVADSPVEFARQTCELLGDEHQRRALARSARLLVERERNSRESVKRLEAVYRREVGRMRACVANAQN